jgi:hypothetical protein
MKINRIDTYGINSTPQKGKEKDLGFNEIFHQKISGGNPVGLQKGDHPHMQVVTQSEKVLGLLDNLVRDLDDPKKTLKEMGPLVKSIEKEVHLMESESSSSPGTDHELDRLVEDVAITARVALFKYQRGDYVS